MATKHLGQVLAPIAAMVSVVATGALAQDGSQGRDRDELEEGEAYAIGLWGDLPYSDLQALVGVPNLIADMNEQHLAFSVHDGDLKAGNGTPGSVTPTTCSDALYEQGLRYFNALEAPAIFTPGDNDWTDCDRPANGGYNSRERLDHERHVFFSTPYSLAGSGWRSRPESRSASVRPGRRPAWRTGAGRWAG
jgi:hypothetical protein